MVNNSISMVSRPIARWEVRLIKLVLFCAIAFAALPAGFQWSVNPDDPSIVNQGSLIFQLQWASVFLVSIYVVYRHRSEVYFEFRTLNPFLIAICAYCLCTVIWSPLPLATLKKSLQFAGLIMFSLAVYASKKPWTDHVLVILSALTLIEIASVIAAIGFPSQGIDFYFGTAWKGILDNKNSLGGVASLSLLLWASIGHLPKLNKLIYWMGIGLSVLCVVKSTSSTSITMSIFGFFIYFLLQKKYIYSPQWLQRVLVLLMLIALVLFQWFFIFESRFPNGKELLGPFASLFGKSSDLTGRSEIWDAILFVIQDHWIFGIGYGAFWYGLGSPAQAVLNKLTWIPFQAHNGYLDTLNELGVIGIILLIGILVYAINGLGKLIKIDRHAAALFTALPATILFSNYTETSMFRGITYQFNLLIFSFISITSILNKYKNENMKT